MKEKEINKGVNHDSMKSIWTQIGSRRALHLVFTSKFYDLQENYDHMHAILVEVTMQEKDEDKDGAINLREYLGEVRVLDLEVRIG